MDALPEVLYLQIGEDRNGPTMMPNRTPAGALRRDLGNREAVAGSYVGVYKRERIVSLKQGVIVEDIPVGAPPPPVTETELPSAQG
jgi:hypothetical protein